MEQIEHIDNRGRYYKALKDGDVLMIVGPPEDLFEELGLPEHFVTRLHNILYQRGILSFRDAARKPQELTGALQEAYRLDAQKLMEMLFKYENQEVHHD
jgi:hypothetical protein